MLPLDPEALLVALALAPETYSRNRFFHLYTDAAARRVRRRAAVLRSIIRHLSGDASGAGVEALAVAPAESGGALLMYDVPALGLKRTVALDDLDLAIVRVAVARRRAAAPARGEAAAPGAVGLPAARRPQPADGERIDATLARLLPPEYERAIAGGAR